MARIKKNDKEEYVSELALRIEKLNKQFYMLNKIVILPFAHFSYNLASPKMSKEFISQLSSILKDKGFEVFQVTFGTHKDMVFEIPGQPAEVSYFEFPYPDKKPEVI